MQLGNWVFPNIQFFPHQQDPVESSAGENPPIQGPVSSAEDAPSQIHNNLQIVPIIEEVEDVVENNPRETSIVPFNSERALVTTGHPSRPVHSNNNQLAANYRAYQLARQMGRETVRVEEMPESTVSKQAVSKPIVHNEVSDNKAVHKKASKTDGTIVHKEPTKSKLEKKAQKAAEKVFEKAEKRAEKHANEAVKKVIKKEVKKDIKKEKKKLKKETESAIKALKQNAKIEEAKLHQEKKELKKLFK